MSVIVTKKYILFFITKKCVTQTRKNMTKKSVIIKGGLSWLGKENR